jgi:hypothetical protein
VNAYGEPVPDYNDGLIPLKDKANMVLYLLVYQSELIHATIHVSISHNYLTTIVITKFTSIHLLL